VGDARRTRSDGSPRPIICHGHSNDSGLRRGDAASPMDAQHGHGFAVAAECRRMRHEIRLCVLVGVGRHLHHARVDALCRVASCDVDARVHEDDDGHWDVERGRGGEDYVRVAGVRWSALAVLGGSGEHL
ncbi:hypothetical protein PFISCL1PPCAC_21698, partial [Pristionchus fissidentatus]